MGTPVDNVDAYKVRTTKKNVWYNVRQSSTSIY